MSKKKLLSEATVRQFMKYANIGHLTENFIDEGDMYEEEEELDLGAEEGPVPPIGDEGPEGDLGDLGDEEPGEEPAEEQLPPEAVTALEGALETAVDAMFSALAPYGVEGEATVTDGGEGEEAPVEDPMGGMGDEAPEVDLGDEAPVEDEEGVLEGVDMIDEDEVVNETLRRVSRRIKGMQKRERLAETVTNRIMKRLRKNK